jgi:hypothetical protein
VTVAGELSPGRWRAPPGTKPAWNWIPQGFGLQPRLDMVPRWVRIWYRLPFVDRYAHVWMWHHGGWLLVPDEPEPGPDGGVREPLRA